VILPVATPGSAAVVWSPASTSAHIYPQRFARGVSALKSLGYEVQLAPSASGASNARYLDAASLADEAHKAASDECVGLIVSSSGGWTSLSLLPHLDMEFLAAHPKVFMGYSDLTALLNVITARTGLITYLGPMILLEFGECGGLWPFTRESFCRAVGAKAGDGWTLETSDSWTDEMLPWDVADSRRRIGTSHNDPPRTLRAGSGQGVLWGGSIRSLGLLAGTSYWPRPVRQSVLALEDEAMSPDELFAYLTALRWSGAFNQCAAVLFGRFSRPRPNTAGFADLDAVIKSAVPSPVPIVAGLDFGHTEPKHTLPIGAHFEVDATITPALITVRL
jgi:muramoyltetrapeptide carboxypeptidase